MNKNNTFKLGRSIAQILPLHRIPIKNQQKEIITAIVTIFALVVFGWHMINTVFGLESELSLATCYANYVKILDFTNNFSTGAINMTNPGAKNVITNMCNHFHDEYGVWINPFTDKADQYPMDVDKFLAKYYSNGIPGPDLKFLREFTQFMK